MQRELEETKKLLKTVIEYYNLLAGDVAWLTKQYRNLQQKVQEQEAINRVK